MPASSILDTKRQYLIVGMGFVLTMVVILLGGTPVDAAEVHRDSVTINSVKELSDYAGKSGHHVRMEPGIYRMTDYISLNQIDDRRESEKFQFITFSGSDNMFDLRGVTIVFDTELREKLNPPIHTPEFVLSGDNNEIRGVSIINTGDGSSDAGNVLSVTGNGNTLRETRMVVRGSYPYGYGDLLGFGGKPHQQLHGEDGERLIDVEKHSGVAIGGDNNRFIGCRVQMRSLGHAFHIHGADNTVFRDCYVEGKMRPTDEMRANPSGPHDEYDFPDVWEEYYSPDSEEYDLPAIGARGGRIKPGHVKSLSEDAFRFYSAGKTTFINCTAKNMRKGFSVNRGGPAYLENCVAIGCGDGFRVGDADDVLKNCRGDARYGPLLIFTGRESARCSVDLALMPAESELKGWRHGQGIGIIGGEGKSRISIAPWKEEERESEKPITLGWRTVRNITLINHTTMPVVITENARDCKVKTKGEVLQNEGKNIEIIRIDD